MTAFACVCGDGDATGLEQFGGFAVCDAKGRNWICREENTPDAIAAAVEVTQLEELLDKHGVHHEGTMTTVRDCERGELASLLARS